MAKAKGKSKSKSKSKKKTAKTREPLVVGSKVKEAIKQNDLMMSGELLSSLNDAVYALIDKACQRAKDNGRKTVQARDL